MQQNITALIGENESGKTNVLLQLCKLTPTSNTQDTKLKLIDNFPRGQYNLVYNSNSDNEFMEQTFIESKFVRLKKLFVKITIFVVKKNAGGW